VGNPTWPLETPDPKDSAKKIKTERGVVKDRIDRRQKLRTRTDLDSAALAVDLLRFGQPLEAETALKGLRRGFLPNVTLAHVAATQGEWPRAFDYLDIANAERPPPAADLGLTPQQLAWQIKLNRGPLMKLVQSRAKEARGPKLVPEDELPDPIFPVNFADAPGGALAPAEQAKLPPDALASVQQLVLWFPHDTRLYWLLGELYAAKGEFAAAKVVMDECAWSLQYGNRKVLMQHREAVTKAAKEKGAAPDEPLLAPPTEEPAPPPPAVPFTMGAVWVYFGAVAAIAVFAFTRAMLKRKKGSGGSAR
jgi:hypothetical protein